MSEVLMCPIAFACETNLPCQGESCAWWRDGACAIFKLASNMDEMVNIASYPEHRKTGCPWYHREGCMYANEKE